MALKVNKQICKYILKICIQIYLKNQINHFSNLYLSIFPLKRASLSGNDKKQNPTKLAPNATVWQIFQVATVSTQRCDLDEMEVRVHA